uniref:VWFA domain-containing protein n=1 Tax=Ciona savignyi TaxID=51511 RepID=H2YC87_CIOSA
MFLLDGSGSLNTLDFENSIDFVKQIVATFDLRKNKIGIMQFSHWFRNRVDARQDYLKTEIRLGQFASHIRFNLAADSIRHHGFTTYTAHAIDQAVRVDLATSDRFSNPCTKKAIVVITDGPATDSSLILAKANAARDRNVVLFAVGVRRYEITQLQEIANGVEGSNRRVYTSRDYIGLHSIVPMLRDELHNLLSDGSVTNMSAP